MLDENLPLLKSFYVELNFPFSIFSGTFCMFLFCESYGIISILEGSYSTICNIHICIARERR